MEGIREYFRRASNYVNQRGTVRTTVLTGLAALALSANGCTLIPGENPEINLIIQKGAEVIINNFYIVDSIGVPEHIIIEPALKEE